MGREGGSEANVCIMVGGRDEYHGAPDKEVRARHLSDESVPCARTRPVIAAVEVVEVERHVGRRWSKKHLSQAD